MKIFLTADLHLGHANIIQHCRRPFSDVHEMNKVLVDNWNEAIGKDDLVYFLGDFCWNMPSSFKDKLNGHKILIKGNHDGKKNQLPQVFESIVDYAEIKLPDHNRVILCHYPFESWNGSNHGSFHCHGHCHGTLTKRFNRIDVGVDCNNFKPYLLEDAIQAIIVQNTERLKANNSCSCVPEEWEIEEEIERRMEERNSE